MRIYLTIIVTLTISLNSFASHWLTYYVYSETEYLQGTWTRMNILEQSNYKYLTVEVYEDLFGSEEKEIVDKFISRLKTNKPELYNWNYDLTFQADTVVITTKDIPENIETIQNEITATLTFNNFNAVTFNFGNHSETLTNSDLTIPYFDLVSKQMIKRVDLTEIQKSKGQNQIDNPSETKNIFSNWLILSIIFNVVLVCLLAMNRLRK